MTYKLSFKGWMVMVNSRLFHQYGIWSDALPYYPFQEAYDRGENPHKVASNTMKLVKE